MAIPLRTLPQVTVHLEDAALSFLPHGARVKDRKPAVGDDPRDWGNPTHVYLIYITQNTNNKWIARHMYATTGSNHLATATTLFEAAKRNEMNNPPRVGNNFVDLIWNEPCYLYLVLDLDGAHFIDDDAPEFDPIQFYDEKPILNIGPAIYRTYDANRSFYNGEFDTISGRSVFRCINYFKDDSGNEITFPQVRFYGFKIMFNAPYVDGTVRPHDIDPDGQNQGPPAVPFELELRVA